MDRGFHCRSTDDAPFNSCMRLDLDAVQFIAWFFLVFRQALPVRIRGRADRHHGPTMFPQWVLSRSMISLAGIGAEHAGFPRSLLRTAGGRRLKLAPRSLNGGAGCGCWALWSAGHGADALWGNATLLTRWARVGTASMFLTPVLIVGLVIGSARLHLGRISAAFGAADAGGVCLFRAVHGPPLLPCCPRGNKYGTAFW